jgi:single stranded DNA-binding protein
MPSINNCDIAGHAGRDAEIIYHDAEGHPSIASVSVAVTESIKAGGEWRKETTWVKVKAIGTTARMLAQAKKGSLVVVCGGALRTESWTGKADGQAKSQSVILVMRPAVCFCVPAGGVSMPEKGLDTPSAPQDGQSDGGTVQDKGGGSDPF